MSENHKRQVIYRDDMIGGKPCEISLAKILRDYDNPYMTAKVMSFYMKYKDGLKAIGLYPARC